MTISTSIAPRDSDTAESVREGRSRLYLSRFAGGEWRAPIFRDMVLDDAANRGTGLTFVDIGCGRGFDGDIRLQRSLAEKCRRYIGIEPDRGIALGPHFTETYRCPLEEALVERDSVDVAFAVMVLEHLAEPRSFFDQVFRILKPGGLFWGFTMDARHFFCWISQLMESMHLKDIYLNRALGKRGVERYENYPTFYRANSPAKIASAAAAFRSSTFLSFARIGQLDNYTPQFLRPAMHLLDRTLMSLRCPGSVLAIRLQK